MGKKGAAVLAILRSYCLDPFLWRQARTLSWENGGMRKRMRRSKFTDVDSSVCGKIGFLSERAQLPCQRREKGMAGLLCEG